MRKLWKEISVIKAEVLLINCKASLKSNETVVE